MNILSVIDLYKIKRGDSIESSEFNRRLNQARTQLTDFVKSVYDRNSINHLCLIDPQFIESISRHLISSVQSNNKQTAYRWIQNLRRLTRGMIREGLLPNIDVFPHVEYKLHAEMPDFEIPTKQSFNNIEAPNFANELERLMRLVETKGSMTTKDQKVALYYLFSIYCYGIELCDLSTLEHSTDDNNKAIIIIPKYGISIAYTGIIRTIAERCNGKKYVGKKVFKIFEGKDADECNKITKKLSNNLCVLFSKLSIKLYQSKSAQSDWLAIALCCGVSDSTIQCIAHAIAEDNEFNTINDKIIKVSKYLNDRKGYIAECWRVLCSYSPILTSDKIVDKLKNIHSFLPIGQTTGTIKTYNPQEISKKRVKGKLISTNRPAMGRYVFVKCKLADCEKIEKYISNASFLRQLDNHSVRATISDDEINRLMAFVKDYGDNIDVVSLKEWARQKELNLEEGQRVVISDGIYAGYEGIIINKKDREDSSGSSKLFIVKITQLSDLAIACNATIALRGLDIKAI